MPNQRLKNLPRAALHHLEALARGQRQKEIQFEFKLPLRVVRLKLEQHG
jgi:hypothetical protein